MTKQSVEEVTVDFNDVDMLSAFSQDPDPKTAQRQTSEYKEFTNPKTCTSPKRAFRLHRKR